MHENPADAEIYSVSQLNREARRLLETTLPSVWVEGEISNLAQPGSGHIYFSLKDDQAQVRCAMFRGAQRGLGFRPADGTQVLARARVSIYEPRGSYQLIVEQMELAGEGILRRRFEELKQRLAAEGLFADARKQALPELPQTVGVVTSPTGAAVRDILHILARRFPLARVIIYPTRVQGDSATAEIVAAIEQAGDRGECDVLIVGRGGGSLEDLWCFNEESVARAIAACPLPIVAGVGHEVDFTIADFVADVRAPTPSGAAELITPDTAQLLATLRETDRRLLRNARKSLADRALRYRELVGRLRRAHPGSVLRQLQQRSDELSRQLNRAILTRLNRLQLRRGQLDQALLRNSPAMRITRARSQLDRLETALQARIDNRLQAVRYRLAAAAGQLNAVSPLATLQRGYAIVQRADTGRIVSDASTLTTGDRIEARLANGRLNARVESVATTGDDSKR